MRHRRGVGRLRLRLVAALVEAVAQEKQKRIERSRHVAKLSDCGAPLRPPTYRSAPPTPVNNG